ncbi:MAG: zf-HC2 domain-containing protein [Candidatus Eisenbacteria bacterium]|nr:zf-HC2 domain-containing protein [Candidatus Eisenbacteria bacterium]
MRNPERGCGENVELIIRHLDGLLSAEESAELEAHLAGCAVCRAEFLLQKRIRDALTEEVHPRLSVDFTSLVRQRVFEAEAPAPVRRRLLRVGLVPAFGLLAVTVLMFAVENGFREAFVGALGPVGNAMASAAAGVGEVFSRMTPRTVGMPDLNLSTLSALAQPLTVTLLLLLCVLPVVWCFRRVGEFLTH